jgi:ELWxxDGT repeat protein
VRLKPPSKSLTGPSIAPALGLRAGNGVVFIVPQTGFRGTQSRRSFTMRRWLSRRTTDSSHTHRHRSRLRLEQLEDRTVPTFVASLVADINPGTPGSTPYLYAQLNGTLFLTADDGVHGRELWKSDGAATGTILVKDIYPGPTRGIAGTTMTAFNGLVYFTADDGVHGAELWRTDGTADGTVLFADLNPGPAGSKPTTDGHSMTVFNGCLYFTADDGARGVELWKTDGTLAGTTLVADINPGPGSSFPGNVVVLAGKMVFTADNGTVGQEIWATDGTTAGTSLVKDVRPGATTSGPAMLRLANGAVVFVADDGSRGQEMWRTDGTAAGTYILKDIVSGSGTSTPRVPTTCTAPSGVQTVYFWARTPSRQTLYWRLWKTDGTPAGTVEVSPGINFSGLGQWGTDVNGVYFFSGSDQRGFELWKSDGTAAGTVILTNRSVDCFPEGLYAANGRLFFSGYSSAAGRELWTSDGTPAGTVMVADLIPGTDGSGPANFLIVGSILFFTTGDLTHGRELWRLDLLSPGP